MRFVEKKASAKSKAVSHAREIRPGDELAPGDLARSYEPSRKGKFSI